MSSRPKANLTLRSFNRGGNGGRPSACDNRYYSDDELLVALSTGWFDHRRDVPSTSESVAMEKVLRRRLLINVTLEPVVILLTITSPLVVTTSFAPQEVSGMPWECPKVNGVEWIYNGLMHNMVGFQHLQCSKQEHIYVYLFCYGDVVSWGVDSHSRESKILIHFKTE